MFTSLCLSFFLSFFHYFFLSSFHSFFLLSLSFFYFLWYFNFFLSYFWLEFAGTRMEYLKLNPFFPYTVDTMFQFQSIMIMTRIRDGMGSLLCSHHVSHLSIAYFSYWSFRSQLVCVISTHLQVKSQMERLGFCCQGHSYSCDSNPGRMPVTFMNNK